MTGSVKLHRGVN